MQSGPSVGPPVQWIVKTIWTLSTFVTWNVSRAVNAIPALSSNEALLVIASRKSIADVSNQRLKDQNYESIEFEKCLLNKNWVQNFMDSATNTVFFYSL